MPSHRDAAPSARVRAAAKATTVACEVPETSRPLALSGKPKQRRHHSITSRSTYIAPWSRPPQLLFIVAATISDSRPLASPVPCTQPKKRGWVLPVANGSTSRTSCSASAPVPMPASASPSARAARPVSPSGCQGCSRAAAKWSMQASSRRCASARKAGQSAGSSGEGVKSGRESCGVVMTEPCGMNEEGRVQLNMKPPETSSTL